MDFCSLRSLLVDLQELENTFSQKVGVSLAQGTLLCALLHGKQDMVQLQQALGLTPSRITRLVDAVVQQGLARRLVVEHDRRSIRLELTETGRNLIETAEQWEPTLPEDIRKLLIKRAEA